MDLLGNCLGPNQLSQSGSLAALQSGSLEDWQWKRWKLVVLMELKETVLQKRLSRADAQGGRRLTGRVAVGRSELGEQGGVSRGETGQHRDCAGFQYPLSSLLIALFLWPCHVGAVLGRWVGGVLGHLAEFPACF